MLYVVIEQTGLEIRQIQVYLRREEADAAFDAMAMENDAPEFEKVDLHLDPPAVLRFAGDSEYCVEIREAELM